MNLQPVNPTNPTFTGTCASCGTRRSSMFLRADLDAKAGTYYCPKCADNIRMDK